MKSKVSAFATIAVAIVLQGSPAMAKIDPQIVKKHIPSESKEPWMTTKTCRAFLGGYEDGTLYLVKDFFAKGVTDPNKLYGQDVGILNLTDYDLSKPVVKEDQTFDQRAEEVKNPDGSTTLEFDLYREFLDTGGYFTRHRATVRIGADGTLLGFDYEKSTAHRRFIIFGSFGDFKSSERLNCG
jgi:hypothetical protein